MVAFGLICCSFVTHAIEVAPRISDREIVESLAELKSGQEHLNQRFEQVDQRFEAMEKTIDARFEAMDRNINARFQSFEKRFSFLENLMMILIVGVFGLIGFVVWDRKTALRPLEKKLDKLEQDL